MKTSRILLEPEAEKQRGYPGDIRKIRYFQVTMNRLLNLSFIVRINPIEQVNILEKVKQLEWPIR